MVLKTITHKGKRVILEFDQGPSLDLHLEAYVEASLREGTTLTPKTKDALLERSAYYDAAQAAFKALSHKPYTLKAMRDKLTLKYSSKTTEAVITMLVQHRYLDDERLLQSRLEDALNFEVKGPKHYQNAWVRYGFSPTNIAQALSHIDESVWLARCEALLEQTLKHTKPLPVAALKRHLYQTALRAGYSGATIEEALRQVTLNDVDEAALLQTAIDRVKGRYDVTIAKDKHALIQRLLRQGFSYEAIKKHLG